MSILQKIRLLPPRVFYSCVLIFLCGNYSFAKMRTVENKEIERLVSLCKLWGKVKYFHPSLAYKNIDWDAALIKAIPKVRTAKTTVEYETALREMLNVLDDASTRIVRNENTANNNDKNGKQLGYQFTKDNILIVTVGNYFALWAQENQRKLKEITAEVPKAKAIVFDLRSAEPVGEYGNFQLNSTYNSIERLISSETILTVGERSRLYKGFESSSAFSSGQYKSGFYIQNSKSITPAQNAKDIPSIFLLNKNSGLLTSIVPLQATGKSLIVFEGETKNDFAVKTEKLDLGENLSAQIRLTEPVLENGMSGDLISDAVIDNSDSALDKALELARNFKSSRVVRQKLPAVSVSVRDKSYAEMKYPSLEYRLLAAFRIWNVIHYFFPYKDLLERDWDLVLREFIPKFEKSKDTLEYSLTVAEMMNHIHDSHAYVSGSVINEFYGTGYPPIRVRIIENQPVVTHFYDEKIAKSAGVEIGDVIVKVEDEDAQTRLNRLAKYFSASTPQSKMDKAVFTFMNDKADSIVSLTLRKSDGREKEVSLPLKKEDFTTLYHRERDGEIIKMLPGNIGYADLDRLTTEMVDEMFERFKSTKAIIFDMRGYPNGTVWWIAPRLTEKKEIVGAFFETPMVGYSTQPKSSEAFYQTISGSPLEKWIYKGLTVMLIDERTQSQAEHTGLFLRAANGTKFIGSPTAGANGEITTFTIPGGIGIGFTGQSVKFSDGKQLQRIGLILDLEIKPSIRGIRENRDEVLEKAIEYLNSNP